MNYIIVIEYFIEQGFTFLKDFKMETASNVAIEGTRTDRRIQKTINKLEITIDYRNRSRVILIADSKGRELRKQRTANTHINIQYFPGAKISNVFLDAAIRRHITRVSDPIVLIWLGTCEISIKSNNGFILPANLDNHMHRLINSYHAYKQQLMMVNPTTTVIFLPCPYLELNTYNAKNGYTVKINQEELERGIRMYNNEINAINSISTPAICEDIQKFGKGKRKTTIAKKIDYRQLIDGCHPAPTITKLWLIKFVRMIDRM